MTLPPLPTAVGTVDEGKYLSLEEAHKRLKKEMQEKNEETKLLAVRLAQSEEAAKRAALASYGGQRAPPGAAKLYEAEQRIAELSSTVADLRRKLAKEREACAAAQRETKDTKAALANAQRAARVARAGLSAGAKASVDGGRDATALAERLHQALDVATGLQEENALLRRAVAQSRRRQSGSSDASGQGGRRTSRCRVSVPRLSLARPPAYDDDPDAEWALEPLRVGGAEMLLDRSAWRLYSRLRDAPWVAAAGTVDASSGEAYLPDPTEQRPDFFTALETHLRSRPSLRLRDIFAAAAADEAAQHADEYSDAEEAAAVAAALGAHALAGLLRGAMPTAAASDVAYFLTMVDPTGVRRLTYPQLAEAMQAATAAEAQHTASLGAARRHIADGVRRSGDRLADFFRRHCPAGAAGLTPQQTAGLLLDVLSYARPEDADPSDAMDEEADARVLLARLRRAAPDADAAAAVSLADLHAELRLTAPAVRTPVYEAGSLPEDAEEGSRGDVAPPRKASRVSSASAPLRASGGAAAAAEASEARRDAESRCAEAEAAAAEAAAEAEAARDEAEAAREEAERLREELRAARDGTLELRRTLERERTRAAAAAAASPQPKAATPARTPPRRQASLDGSGGMATSDAAAAAQSAASAAAAAAAAAAAQHAQSGLELELRSAAARGAEASARADAAEAALSAFKANHAAVLRQLESTHARLADERVATAASAGEARRLGAELAAARELAPLLTAARLERAALEDENKALMAAALAAPATGAELRAARAALAEARRARAEAEGALADAHRELLAFAPPGGGGAGEPDYRSLRAERDALRSAAERSRVELEAANDTLAVMRAAAAAAAERGPPSPPPPPSPVGPSPAEWAEAEAERAALAEAADAAAEELRAAGKRIALLEAQLADARAELAEAQQRASAAGEAASEHAAEQAAELDAARADLAGLRAALAARGEALAAMTSELTAAQAAARAARTAAAAAAAAAAQMAVEEEEPPGAHMAAAVARAEASESARRAAAAALDEADALAEAEEAEAAAADAERVAAASRARQALERAAAAAEAARADAEAELAAAARAAADEDEAAAEARAYAEAEAAAEEAYAQMEADAEAEELDTAEALLARGPRVSHAAGGSRAAPRSSTASVLGPPSDEEEEDDEPPADDGLADDENVLALTLHGLSVERGALRGEASPATFLTVDFFEHETQATPLVHGFAPELEQAYEFVVLVDNLLLQYMEMDCLRVELNVANGLDFRTLGAAAFPLRRLLREVEAGRGRGRGGRTRHTVPFRAVGGDTVGSLTLSCRMARPLDAALAAYRAAAPFAFLQRGGTPPAAPGGGSRASFEFPRMARASVPAEAAPPIVEEEPPAAEDAETAAAEAAAAAAADASVTIRVSHVQLGPDASSDARIRGALVLFDFLADVFPEADQRTPAVLKPAAGGRLSYGFERRFACGSRSNPAAFAALRSALAPRAADADEGGAADVDELADGAVLQFLLVADPGSGGTFRDLGAAELPLHALLARGDVVDAALPISDSAGRPVATVTVSVIGAAAVAAAAAARDDL